MLNWKGTLVLVPGSGSLNKLGVKTELESKVNGFFLSWMSLRLKVKADHNEYFLYSWGHSLRHSSYYGGPQLSRQKQKPHGKTENLTAKAKTSRQNQNTPRQNQKPHGKTKDLTAKPNTSQQKTKYPTAKANTHGKTKVILLTVKYLVFPWDFLFSLPWGILFLPWHGCGPPYSFHMTPKKNALTGIVSDKNLFLCSQNALLHALLVL